MKKFKELKKHLYTDKTGKFDYKKFSADRVKHPEKFIAGLEESKYGDAMSSRLPAHLSDPRLAHLGADDKVEKSWEQAEKARSKKARKDPKNPTWKLYREEAKRQIDGMVLLESSELDIPTHTPEEIANKHGVTVQYIHAQLKRGIEVEHEHTSTPKVAREIALDHLGERPDYYTKLDHAKLEEGLTPREKMSGSERLAQVKDVPLDHAQKQKQALAHHDKTNDMVQKRFSQGGSDSGSKQALRSLKEADLQKQWNTDFNPSYHRRSNLRRTMKQQLAPKTPGLGNKAWNRADKEHKKNSPYVYSVHEPAAASKPRKWRTLMNPMQTANEGVKDKTLQGHPYHHKSDAELHYIIKDAGEAEKAIGSHDKKAMWKYGDQQSDAASVLAYRRRGGKRIPEPIKEENNMIIFENTDSWQQFAHHWTEFKKHDALSDTDRTHLTPRNHHEREMNKHYKNLTTQQKNALRLTESDIALNESYKVGDKVVANIGPHKGTVHTVIHVHPTGHLNIKPDVHVSRNRYHLGATKADPKDVTRQLEESSSKRSFYANKQERDPAKFLKNRGKLFTKNKPDLEHLDLGDEADRSSEKQGRARGINRKTIQEIFQAAKDKKNGKPPQVDALPNDGANEPKQEVPGAPGVQPQDAKGPQDGAPDTEKKDNTPKIENPNSKKIQVKGPGPDDKFQSDPFVTPLSTMPDTASPKSGSQGVR
jgi:hypothetical protein